jgi:RND superfamily putative drug exporter
VLISGMTVMIAMAGMFLTGQATFASFATGTMIVVAVAMVGSVTFLPALLAALGDRIDKGRIPGLMRRRGVRGTPASARLLRPVIGHPLASGAAALALLAALAVPAFGLHTLVPGVRSVPANLPVMKTYSRIQAAFPGSASPAEVVVQARDVRAPAMRAAVVQLEAQAQRTHQIGGPMSLSVNHAGTVAVVEMSLAGNGTDAQSNRALALLRKDLIPRTVGAVPGAKADVTGMTASSKDFNDLLSARTPLVFAFVLGLAFLLLLFTFRSVVIPITAIVLNLLSVGAGYGAMALVFQHHWAEGLLGFTSIGGVTSWLPLFMFVILFGLSMDYHVFILSRIKEAHDRGLGTRDAVAEGIGASAGAVTSAAAVMVAVFAIFASLSMLELKEFGVGLAAAVLIDATIIRGVLLPATMTLLGEANWYMPRFMGGRARPRRGRAELAPEVS